MGKHAATVTVTLEDDNGLQTSRSYEAKSAAIADATAIALSDQLQTLTQLSVVDVVISRRPAGFQSDAPETNSSVAETASITVKKTEGDRHTFNMPALKAAYKSGSGVNGSHADILAFLENFDDGAGVAGVAGNFYVSDKEELSEISLEGSEVDGKVNR